jgi:hypothetical protein
MSKRTHDVRPSERGWEVAKRRGTILGTYASKETALQAARIVAEGNAPSEVGPRAGRHLSHRVDLRRGSVHSIRVSERLLMPWDLACRTYVLVTVTPP